MNWSIGLWYSFIGSTKQCCVCKKVMYLPVVCPSVRLCTVFKQFIIVVIIIIFSSFQEWDNAMVRRPSSVRLSVRPSVCPSVNFCANRFFSQTNGRIATKLAQDGLQVNLHPGCAQGQGQGQRSRDTRTFLDSWNELLRHWRSGFVSDDFAWIFGPRYRSHFEVNPFVCRPVDPLAAAAVKRLQLAYEFIRQRRRRRRLLLLLMAA